MTTVRTEALSKRYGDTLALDRLDLTIDAGEVYGYLGPNGAGKTTTIRLLLGLHRPSSGDAKLFGIDAWRGAVKAHRRVAYVAGEPALWPGMTAAETLEFLARVRGGADHAYRDVLVDEGTLADLRHLRAQTIEVTFDGPAPTLGDMPGVRVAGAGTNALRFEVSGSAGPLVAALAAHRVRSLRTREPSLEEIFLHHYERR